MCAVAKVRNPVHLLADYLRQVSAAEELDRDPLMEPGLKSKVKLWFMLMTTIADAAAARTTTSSLRDIM